MPVIFHGVDYSKVTAGVEGIKSVLFIPLSNNKNNTQQTLLSNLGQACESEYHYGHRG